LTREFALSHLRPRLPNLQELTRITRDTAAFDTLLEAHAAAREDIAHHDRIVIRLGETWYLVEPAADSEEGV
jgi:hypothetical protein